ncbi:MAG: radical SAM protein, partial [Spirochaetota bacterium]|nr:radical SAM protein [Spirochaetota bacterium]
MINILKKLLKKIMPDFLFRIIYKTASWTYDLINSQFKQKRLKMFEKIENQKDEKRKYLLYPELVSIFLTTKCNLKCFICRPDGFSGENLKLENLYKLKNAIHYAKIIELTGWGEAFIYKDLEKVLKYIYSVNNKDIIRITTNGTKLSKKWAELLSGHLYSLNISLNAATKETYESQMIGGNFEKTIANIESFTSA